MAAPRRERVLLEAANGKHGKIAGYQQGCKCEDCLKTWQLYTRKYQLPHHLKRVKMLAEIKMARGCADCGYNENPVALDFDHVSGTKSFTIGSNPRGSWDGILNEIEKCDVVCTNCHRIRTHNRKQHMTRSFNDTGIHARS